MWSLVERTLNSYLRQQERAAELLGLKRTFLEKAGVDDSGIGKTSASES
jgi:hypothetical protein